MIVYQDQTTRMLAHDYNEAVKGYDEAHAQVEASRKNYENDIHYNV